MNFIEHFVRRDQHRIYAREYPGEEPVIVLMHGFPDNMHLYDRLVPYLSPPRRVITFDFLGWGGSDRVWATGANHFRSARPLSQPWCGTTVSRAVSHV